jgi:hypothetical protein
MRVCEVLMLLQFGAVCTQPMEHTPMAKKRPTKMDVVPEEKTSKAVRLELSLHDIERLERCARERGLSNASYARMAVLERIKTDEGSK